MDRELLASRAAKIQPVQVRLCPDADAEHAGSERQYCHVVFGLRPVVCVAQAFLDLPRDHRLGLLAHEVGHLLAGRNSSEAAADQAFETLTGVRIRYKNSGFGECLQFMNHRDAKRLEGLFRFDLDFDGPRNDGRSKRRNPDDLLSVVGGDAFLPALVPGESEPGQWAPPRTSFELLASGRSPLVYAPAGVVTRPVVVDSLKKLLSRRGMADVNTWEELFLKAKKSGADLFVVDRRGDRWHVRDVHVDFGGETGQLEVLQVGPDSRRGTRSVDVHKAFGWMIPVVVYRSTTKARTTPKSEVDLLREEIAALWRDYEKCSIRHGQFEAVRIRDQIAKLEERLARVEGRGA